MGIGLLDGRENVVEEIAKEYGMCMLYMIPVLVFAVFYVSLLKTDGMLYNVIMAYLNGLTG